MSPLQQRKKHSKRIGHRISMHRAWLKRGGTAAVEFAMIAPLMIGFTFGMLELGRIMMVKQTATHASREGARIAIRPSSQSEEVIERVEQELAVLGIEDATVELDPESIEDAEPGSTIKVRVAVSIASITWVSDFLQLGDADIIAESSMRRESTE
jgi:hypothetical protein